MRTCWKSFAGASNATINQNEAVSFTERAGRLSSLRIKVLCEQTRELTHDFLDYV